MRAGKKFVMYLKEKNVAWTVEGALYIYVGGGYTTWKNLLPVFQKALIQEFKNDTA
jgi:hypothetical protein